MLEKEQSKFVKICDHSPLGVVNDRRAMGTIGCRGLMQGGFSMKKFHKLLGVIAIGAVIAIGLAGCNNPADNPTDNSANDKEDSKLTAPTGVKAVALSSSTIRVTWNSVSGASGYYVYRSQGAYWTKIGSTQYISYTDTQTGFVSGHTYLYMVIAYNSEGESAVSEEAYATIP
jgi:hypothetical protein